MIRDMLFLYLGRYRSGIFAGGLLGLFVFYYTDSRAGIHTYGTNFMLRTFFPAEIGHQIALKVLRWKLGPWDKKTDDTSLMLNVWGHTISNPVGLAAGMDKQGEAIDGLLDLGFGYIEIGTVTPHAQPGNPPPRFFRLSKDAATINRYGFNSDGHDVVVRRLHNRILKYAADHCPELMKMSVSQLSQFTKSMESMNFLNIPKSLRKNKLLAINLGKNRDGNEINDYLKGIRRLGPYADAIKERNLLSDPKPVLCIKIAPDLNDFELQDIVDVIKRVPIDGIIVSNTTIQRPKTLKDDRFIHEQGGLSGPPLKPLTLNILRILREKLPKDFIIIGCGGISSGKDAIEYARAGASLVQCYTAFGKDEIYNELKGKKWIDIIGIDEIKNNQNND
ncbi:hypothetical protein PMAC_000939 [Pneumocystis sp. 'macacae']|nr:hypothetical protein PMAC_000939 [Pneumocystis sp. 'macacae']